MKQVQDEKNKIRKENGLTQNFPIPADLATNSGSSLDPDINLDSALLQVKRVAKARHLPEDAVRQLVLQDVKEPWLLGRKACQCVGIESDFGSPFKKIY